MSIKKYKFQYMPLEGRLLGKVMEQQTEDAINDLGIWLVDVSDDAENALTLAQDAYDRAIDAQSTADKAQSAADNAQNTADEALRAAGNAQSSGNQAQTSADEAMAAAKAAQESADHAQESADDAMTAAENAQLTAVNALTAANAAQDSAAVAQEAADNANYRISAVNDEIDSITTYEVVTDGEDDDGNVEVVDLNGYDYFARIHVAAGTLNAPTADEEFFVDCDINSDGNTVRQIAVGVDTKDIWLRYGVPQEGDEPETVWGTWRKSSAAEGVVYKFCGSVETYDDLPEDPVAGDVYNIAEADEEHHIKAGDNVAWTGEEWDNLSGIFDTSGLETKISEVLQVANNAQEAASTAQSTADKAQSAADDALQRAIELLQQLLTVVNDVEYADSTLTVTKADGTTKEFTIAGGGGGLSGTVGSTTQPVYLNDGDITACSTTVGGAAKPIYSNAGVLTAISNTVGSATQPIYSSSGTLTACNTTVGGTAKPIYSNAGVLTAISSTVGSGTVPIYSNGGTLTASSSTVGSGTKPVYLNSGTITACGSTVGSGTVPIYSSSGTLTASTSTVGSATKPVYLSSGTITASGSTVGSSTQPVYLSSGTITACSTSVANVTYSHSAESAGSSAGKGYIKIGSNVMICYGGDGDGVDCTFAATFSNNPFVLCTDAEDASSNMSKNRQRIGSISTSKFSIANTDDYTRYIAIGRYA